ncbi:protein kinase domain-containing protein [Roseofilum casamattae]|uniref:non-specific serine/threonine protein kinase n=1 Tax=Roseofilum casamattae BLCC-M143 TaxID=3022442 RepID=A0ABT7C2A4_9CYAN|nr:GUN4 domain-containing protein [Roseofilum casamattae]MDJ1185595.1 GUN4 domain-containing protein [Roseofilum casamattae BLCC-M143]
MSYCTNPDCKHPKNPDTAKYCSSCGAALHLRQRYRPLTQLGQGGFGKTFIAIDEDIPSQPTCAIKQLYLKGFTSSVMHKAKQLFRQEAVRLDDLGKHDQIPSLLAHFEQDEQCYLVQEFIEGPTLSQELQQKSYYTGEEVEELLRDLLPVLQFIHDRNVIHRDIKPGNIIRRNSDRLPVLIDFGVSKWVSQTTLNQTGTVVGSADYMPLEQLQGKVFPASDLYSLGVTCLHLLTGISPFDLYDVVGERWVWRDYLLPENRISSSLTRVLDSLVARSVRDRFQSASEVLQALPNSSDLSTALTMQPAKRKANLAAESRQALSPRKNSRLLANPIHVVKTWISNTEEAKLDSSTGINYTKLNKYLQAKRWKEADEETWNCLHQAAGSPMTRFLSDRDLSRISCDDWMTVDRLWVEASEGRFGFSIQVQIYQQMGEDYIRFCEGVKWPLNRSNNMEKQIQFKPRAPVGHLPSPLRFQGKNLAKNIKAIASGFVSCDLL